MCGSGYLLVMDKHTRRFNPPGAMNMMAGAWIEMRQRTDAIWPDQGTVEY